MDEDKIEIPVQVGGFEVFGGEGRRLDGKIKPNTSQSSDTSQSLNVKRERGVPNYNYIPGSLTFFRNLKALQTEKVEEKTFKPFGGVGHRLKTHPI